MSEKTLLVVEDDAQMQKQLGWGLRGFGVLQAANRTDALALARSKEPAVVLLDLGLPPDPGGTSEGFATLKGILSLLPKAKVVILTGQDTRGNALDAIAYGAHDFHDKTVDLDHLAIVLERAFYIGDLEAENERLQTRGLPERMPGLVGDSPAMLQLFRTIDKTAPADVSVVLLGESGTGKEVVARSLHRLSERRKGRFVAINCAAIPAPLLEAELFGHERGAFTGAFKRRTGKIELAHGGILFLDEIGDLPLDLQAKLLRFLQERVVERIGGREEIPVDVRVVCATHRDLEALVKEGAFREDLYYRLCEIALPIPPLRERTGDAILLARHFLTAYGRGLGRRGLRLAPEALAAIDAYAWPGNVRELQNRLKRALIMAEGGRIGPGDLDLAGGEEGGVNLNLRRVREEAEMGALRRALAQSQGNVSKTARLLGVSRPTLYDLLRQHGFRG
ncbi:MAG: PEP-CTERM-box response regulator transcription factor [Geminicoccaceae bacterium]|nr:PEP-CTERM-box response regulator transcription factor [Geminicoccaceae bacterium]